MNERIKELATRARRLGNDDVSHLERVHNRTYTLDEVNDIHYEKFAKLIVAECAGIYDMIDNGNLHMGTDDYLEALRKTFV
jgi:hypothetical protein